MWGRERKGILFLQKLELQCSIEMAGEHSVKNWQDSWQIFLTNKYE